MIKASKSLKKPEAPKPKTPQEPKPAPEKQDVKVNVEVDVSDVSKAIEESNKELRNLVEKQHEAIDALRKAMPRRAKSLKVQRDDFGRIASLEIV